MTVDILGGSVGWKLRYEGEEGVITGDLYRHVAWIFFFTLADYTCLINVRRVSKLQSYSVNN